MSNIVLIPQNVYFDHFLPMRRMICKIRYSWIKNKNILSTGVNNTINDCTVMAYWDTQVEHSHC